MHIAHYAPPLNTTGRNRLLQQTEFAGGETRYFPKGGRARSPGVGRPAAKPVLEQLDFGNAALPAWQRSSTYRAYFYVPHQSCLKYDGKIQAALTNVGAIHMVFADRDRSTFSAEIVYTFILPRPK